MGAKFSLLIKVSTHQQQRNMHGKSSNDEGWRQRDTVKFFYSQYNRDSYFIYYNYILQCVSSAFPSELPTSFTQPQFGFYKRKVSYL